MGISDDKIKNSKRRHRDEVAIKKQTKIAKQHNVSGYDSKVAQEPHRFNKHHAMDCGNPECYLCGNPRKTHKDKLTAQEKRLFQDLDKTTDKHSNGLKNDQEDLL
jgi:FPC/CPF motif-containing protein YcgG